MTDQSTPRISGKSRERILLILVFMLSLSTRFALSFYNREANDNHMEVITWIVDKNEVPVKENCWECSQPKLYYLLNAAVINLLHIENADKRIVCVQMVNFFFSILLLIFAWAFIRNQNFEYHIKILGFCLVAFNPCLTGINAQATNDTLEILAGTMTIYFADIFFRRFKYSHLAGLTLSLVLACITKGSGLSLALALFIVFVIYIVITPNVLRKKLLMSFAIFTVVFFSIVPFAGGYFNNYKKYDNAFINNISKMDSPPEFFHRTYPIRPGITSVVDGYFTFRIFDMFKQPYITNGNEGYSLHRTSLLSQLYGRTFFLHFDQHPGSWATMNPNVLLTGKILLGLGLFPLIVFLVGLYFYLKDFIASVNKRDALSVFTNYHWMHFFLFSACMLFIIKYTYNYRDFSTMKSIFIFPVLLSIVTIFMKGFSKIRKILFTRVMTIALSCLTILSLLDVFFLIGQLKK